MNKEGLDRPPELEAVLHVGCSGWRYWEWRNSFYAGVPAGLVPALSERLRYRRNQRVILLLADGRGGPGLRRQPGVRSLSVRIGKVCELITHVKRFKGTNVHQGFSA